MSVEAQEAHMAAVAGVTEVVDETTEGVTDFGRHLIYTEWRNPDIAAAREERMQMMVATSDVVAMSTRSLKDQFYSKLEYLLEEIVSAKARVQRAKDELAELEEEAAEVCDNLAKELRK